MYCGGQETGTSRNIPRRNKENNQRNREEVVMSIIQKPSCASGSSRRRREKPDGAVEDAACQQPNLSHIAPGLRPLAVPVAELSLMVGHPRSYPTQNLEDIEDALVAYRH